jgi:ribosome maturation protein Sdo1
MNKIIEQKINYIFGTTHIKNISEESLKNVFLDLSDNNLKYDFENRYSQIIDLWEAKFGPIILM